MPSAAEIQSVPPPVGALPPPIKSSDGRYKVFLSAPRMDHPYPAHGWQTNVWSATRFDRPIAEAAPWSILLQFLTAMRVHSSEAIDRWTELTSEAEAKLCQQLFAYIQFEDNWDGDGGRVPSLAAANNALWFLANRPADIPLPSPECGTEGDIGLYWENRNARVFAEVVFEGDGTYAYFAVHGDPGAIIEKCGGEKMTVTKSWPDKMLQILRIKTVT